MLDCKIYAPHPLLRSRIKLFSVLTGLKDGRSERLQRVTPDGSFEFNFTLHGNLSRLDSTGKIMQADHYLVKSFSTNYFIKRSDQVSIVGVCFFPWGLQPFVRLPAHEISDFLTLEEIFGSRILALQEEVVNSQDAGAALLILERYFLREVSRLPPVDNLIVNTERKIFGSKGVCRISSLATGYNVSRRHLEQRFRDSIGVSPKFYARLVRFQNAIMKIDHSSDLDLTDLAVDCGYYDQSHFIKDFRAFAGTSPTNYFREDRELNNLMMLRCP